MEHPGSPLRARDRLYLDERVADQPELSNLGLEGNQHLQYCYNKLFWQ